MRKTKKKITWIINEEEHGEGSTMEDSLGFNPQSKDDKLLT